MYKIGPRSIQLKIELHVLDVFDLVVGWVRGLYFMQRGVEYSRHPFLKFNSKQVSLDMDDEFRPLNLRQIGWHTARPGYKYVRLL